MRRALVLLRAGGTTYALGVEQTQGVVEHEALAPLPDPLPGVAGLLRTDDELLTVFAPFTSTGEHVVVVCGPDGPFGLLAEQVTGIVKVETQAIGPAPPGQRTAMVVGVVKTPSIDALLLDPSALASRLCGAPA